jgi:phage repressor protein C with HTH and peptisase S24 domain
MANAWIAQELKRIGAKQADLARHLGVSESVMSKMIHTSRILGAEEERKIRDFVVANDHSTGTRYAPPHSTSSVRRSASRPNVQESHAMPDDLPVFGTAVGGSTGGSEFIMNGQIGLHVRRPEKLSGRDDVFALFVQGDSMEPRYSAGELIICETRRPPQIGDYVVVEMKETADGLRIAYLKRLAGRSGRRLKLTQYNPEKTIELDQDEVHQIVRVMSTLDLVG